METSPDTVTLTVSHWKLRPKHPGNPFIIGAGFVIILGVFLGNPHVSTS